jgi:FtsZ-interacting cell division protein YlmF
MTFKELKDSLLNRVNGKAWGGKQEEPEVVSNMANGGTSGYRPAKAQGRSIFSTQSIPVQQSTQSQPRTSSGMTGRFNAMDGQMQQTQPQNFAPQQDPYTQQQPQQDPWAGFTGNMGSTYQQPMGSTYQQPMGGTYQQPMQQTGYQPYQQQPMGGTYQQPMQQTGYQPYQQQPMDQGYQPQQAQQQPMPDNISYMPGSNFVDDDRRGYAHVERIVQLVSVAACFRIIEFMRNGESVIVNTESIANEADVQRCLDMLAGAAFTLECSLTKITQVKRAYLIAPKTVLVMQDKSFAHWNERDSMQMPEMDDAQESYRQERGAYVPDRRWEQQQEPYQTAGFRPQSMNRTSKMSYTNRQSPVRGEQTQRTEMRGSYNSDTRRGVYATMRHPQGEQQSYGQ